MGLMLAQVRPAGVLGLYLAGFAVVAAVILLLAGRVHWHRRRAFADGERVVGSIVQANTLLFQPGGESAPALVLISFTHPDGRGLEAIAADMGRLKQQSPTTSVEREVAKFVRDETYRPLVRYRLPTSFTPGMEVHAVNVWVERKWLPEGRLTEMRLVCRAIPGDSGAVVMNPPRDG